jgi:predicted MFS family arabinose efflux permease
VVSPIERFTPARLGPGFRWLVSSSWVGSVGDGIALSAGPLLVASETRSAFLVAAAAFLQRVPWLIFGLWAGVIADRVDRRVLIVTSETLRAIVIAVLCVCIFTGDVDIWIVLAAMLLMGTAEVFTNTTTTTLLPMLIGKDDLGFGNSRIQGSYVVGENLLGPPIGAFLFTVGHAWPFFTQAIVVTLAMLLVSRIGSARASTEAPSDGGVIAEIKAGIRWLMGHPPIRTLALIILSFNITWGAAWSVLVLYALRRLHIGEFGYGLLAVAVACGGLLGIAGYGRLEKRWPISAMMRVCLTLEVLMHLSLAINTEGWIAMIVLFIFGAYTFVWGIVSQTVRQRAVPQELQGRVGSVYLMCMFGGIVIGQLIGGVIAQVWGVDATFWFAFIGSGLTLAAVWGQLDQIAHAGD